MAERLIVGISGASGAPLAVALLKALRAAGVEIHLIVSHGGELTIRQECRESIGEVKAMAGFVYDISDIAAAPPPGAGKAWAWWLSPAL